ncbi:serine hydrolase domain-containing protein [Janthinobacterium sp. HH01]|uniref:serine hydrolase domain-containing protein n=1 Tax=Janthinobacterium sp. HH01 TaxID=1198452 RepID=UPI0005B8A753|nr:serine hydrolase domain-containing protein [Janthinobacterium sp. HH01]
MLLASAVPVHAGANAGPAGFDQFVAAEMAARKIPGLSIGYSKDGKIWARGYGYADLENKTPATALSSYRMASVTKPMTAAAVLRLAEQGKLDLDAEIQSYVPYFPRKASAVTVRQLLGHLGGIDAYRNSAVEQHFKQHMDTRQSIDVFSQFDLIAAPGARYRYTSYGYNLLGAAIEGAGGANYGDHMQRAVWGPLGMVDTRLDDPLALIPRRVRGYQLQDGQLRHAEFIDISSRFAAGGTRATVLDMLRFGDGVSQGKLLSPASMTAMFEPMTTTGGDFTGYGMGWETGVTPGRFGIAHDGIQPETSTYLFCFPSRKLTIAVAANLQRVETRLLVQRLFEQLTGEAWHRRAYVADASLQPANVLAQAVFDEGRSWFERNGGAMKADAGELAASLAFVNAWSARPDTASLQAARHPKGGLHLARLGSAMAAALKANGVRLEDYSNRGALSFFADYLALPKAQRMAPALEAAIGALQGDWRSSSAGALRQRDVGSAAGVAALELEMKLRYAGKRAYPDHVAELKLGAMRMLASGADAGALAAAQLAGAWYAADAQALALHGAVAVAVGQRDIGLRQLRTAQALDPVSGASAEALNRFAYELSGAGQPLHGVKVLQGATMLYPDDANLYDSLGELSAAQGQGAQAQQAYRKALELRPDYPNAAVARAYMARQVQ